MDDNTLFLELFQPFAQYRNPFTFYFAQTYPLPPKTTVVGMLQNALDDWYGSRYGDLWARLRVSLHGGFENVFWSYQNLIKGYPVLNDGRLVQKQDKKELPLYGEGKKAQRSPVYQAELFNGRLYVFIRMQEDELINELYTKLTQPRKVLSLGRSEDVIFIRKVLLLEKPEKVKVEGDIKIPYPTYILLEKEEGERVIRLPIANQRYPVFYLPVTSRFYNDNQPIKFKSEINIYRTKREVDFMPVIYTARDYSLLLKDGESIEVEFYKIDSSGGDKIPVICGWGWL